MYFYRIVTRNKKVLLGGVAADSEKLAVEKWYKSGNSRYEIVVAELYGLATNEQKNLGVIRAQRGR